MTEQLKFILSYYLYKCKIGNKIISATILFTKLPGESSCRTQKQAERHGSQPRANSVCAMLLH